MAVLVPLPGMNAEKYKNHSEYAHDLHQAYKNYKPPFKVRVKQLFKELLPHKEWAVYFVPGSRRVVVWSSWLGRKKILFDAKIS